jgi:DNA-binding MarR family transcriptional regulator
VSQTRRRLLRKAQRPGRKPGKARGAAPDPGEGWRAYRSSRHLLALAEAMRLRIREGLIARGHDLGPSHTQVSPNLPLSGIRMTDLAQRLRLTLQRTGQLIRELEEAGYVEVVPHESDGRARVVVHSQRGLALMDDVLEITREAWKEYAQIVGDARADALAETLAALDSGLRGEDAPLKLTPAR